MTAAAQRRGRTGLKEAQIASGESRIPLNDQTPPGRVAAPQSPSTFRQVFGISEFRALWTAQVLSVAGDQLARVALTLLVFHRTDSPLLAAITFAASVVPAFIGGLTLSGLADRLPRRQVMIACDLIRVVLVLVMAVSGIPIAVLVALFVRGDPDRCAVPLSARAALYPDILTGDLYVLGTAVTLTTLQFAQVLGFAAGGATVAFFGVRPSLLIDAATFALSALITRIWVRARPAAQEVPEGAGVGWRVSCAGLRLVFTSPALRTPMLLGWLVAFYHIPEGGSAARGGPGWRGPGGGPDPGCVRPGRLPGRGGVQPPGRPAAAGALDDPIAPLAPGVLILFAFRPPWRPLWPSSRSAESSTVTRSPPTPRSCRPRPRPSEARRSGSSRAE